MEELHPLTISKSLKDAPSVLLTSDYRKFTIYGPISREIIVGNHLYTHLLRHFKFSKPEMGTFSIQNKKYLCIEKNSVLIPFDPWYDYLWETKLKFNQFLRPRTLFEMFLFELCFPIWGETLPKFIRTERKMRFSFSSLPLNEFRNIQFSPLSLSQLGLDTPETRNFLSYIRDDLFMYVDDFFALHHEKFYLDIKYLLSLYPDMRNELWDQIKQCFEPDFIQFIRHQISQFIHRL